ncbi:MAG TPA: tectonin domain-containing protein [Pyrinomonadaceae bacterium]|nr:tectonin domain-containing protein [Pyrinomonadaceae bacterium]
MKNAVTKILFAFLLTAMCGSAIFAQTAERINFEKEGSMSLVWEQMMPKGSTKTYVFRGEKDQTVSFALIEDTGKGKLNFDNFGTVDVSVIGRNQNFKLTEARDYYFTVINESNKQTSFRISISVTDAEGNPITLPIRNTISATHWKKMPSLGETPLLLAIGAGNAVWAVDIKNKVYKLDNDKWTKTDFGGLYDNSTISKIVVDPDGYPWVLADTLIFRLVNNRWTEMPGRANDIFISPLGLVWIVGASDSTGASDNNPILQWNETTRKWLKTKDPAATQIADSGGADAAYLLSLRNDGSVWFYGSPDNAHATKGRWKKMHGMYGTQLSIGGDGTAWLVGDTEGNVEEGFVLYRLDNASNTWKKMEGKCLYLAVDMHGQAWIITRDGNIYQYIGK